jgi:hypothetical protein
MNDPDYDPGRRSSSGSYISGNRSFDSAVYSDDSSVSSGASQRSEIRLHRRRDIPEDGPTLQDFRSLTDEQEFCPPGLENRVGKNGADPIMLST